VTLFVAVSRFLILSKALTPSAPVNVPKALSPLPVHHILEFKSYKPLSGDVFRVTKIQSL
jgi:hypothetical protein